MLNRIRASLNNVHGMSKARLNMIYQHPCGMVSSSHSFSTVSNLSSYPANVLDVLATFVWPKGQDVTVEFESSANRIIASKISDWQLSEGKLRARLAGLAEITKNPVFLKSYLSRYRVDNVLITELPENPVELDNLSRDVLRHIILYQNNLIRIGNVSRLIQTMKHLFPQANAFDLIGKYPQVLVFDWRNRFHVRQRDLVNVFGTIENVNEALIQQPDLLFVSVEKTALPRLEMLQEIVGFTKEEALAFVCEFPRLLSRTVGTVKFRRLLLFRMPHPTLVKALPHDLVSTLDSNAIAEKRAFFHRKTHDNVLNAANTPYKDYFTTKEELFEAVKDVVVMDSRAFALLFPEFTALDRTNNPKEEEAQDIEAAHAKSVNRQRPMSPAVKEEQFSEEGELLHSNDKVYKRDVARNRKDLNDTIHRVQVYGEPLPHEEHIVLKEEHHEPRDRKKEQDLKKKANRRDQVQEAWYGNEVHGVKSK